MLFCFVTVSALALTNNNSAFFIATKSLSVILGWMLTFYWASGFEHVYRLYLFKIWCLLNIHQLQTSEYFHNVPLTFQIPAAVRYRIQKVLRCYSVCLRITEM